MPHSFHLNTLNETGLTMQLGWLDPSLNSRNTGDQIIADAVSDVLKGLFPNDEIVRIPTQTILRPAERRQVEACDRFVVGGTNLLNGNIPRYIQWKLDPFIYNRIRTRAALLGVGWWQYQAKTNDLSSRIWRGLLQDAPNSVRDDYTVRKLNEIGVKASNTSCVTTWGLPETVVVAESRPSAVVFTLTDYHKNRGRDARLIRGLRDRYEHVIAWPQGANDREYIASIDRDVEFLGPALEDFNDSLSAGETDYVGTRLHAGIRALQVGVRAFTVAIDNRANEISRDIGLPILSNDLNDEDWARVDGRADILLDLPRESIGEWKRDVLAWTNS